MWYRSAHGLRWQAPEPVRILHDLSFKDRFYAESGRQPFGYIKETLPQTVKYSTAREEEAK